MIPRVVASESGIAQTDVVVMLHRGSRTAISDDKRTGSCLESHVVEGENPVQVSIINW